ncbi:hypothetical protein LCGC14_2069830 [marine sediment metagenome]|uniref:HTH cro/C1-type domain-containing protein n=1 Tax=marine sediment metagenome TaxID=412755 RepID=A0A0F9HFT0_9ZZZZ
MAEQFISELIMLRHQHGSSLRGFAKALNISPTYLSDLERGRRRPTLNIINKLCECPVGPSTRRWHLMGARARGWKI